MADVTGQLNLNGLSKDTGAVNNALASINLPAIQGTRYFLTGIIASYDAVPAAGNKTITITYTPEGGAAVAIAFYWDPTKFLPLVVPFSFPLKCAYSTTLAITLTASGTGGVNGRLLALYSPM